MKFLHSFRILIFIALFIGMVGFGKTTSIRADDPLTFSGKLGVYKINALLQNEDSEWYTLFAEAGRSVEITLTYSISNLCGAYVEVFVGSQVDILDFNSEIGPQYITTKTYTYVTPNPDTFKIGLRLTAPFTLESSADRCTFDYKLTIWGASFAGYNNETLSFSNYIMVSPRDNIYEDSGLYTLHVDAGQLVVLTVVYDGVNWKVGCITEAYIGSPIGRINEGIYYNGVKKFSRIMPVSENVQIGLILRVTELGHPYGGCGVYYTLTVSGASLTPSNWVSPTDIEEAAGLQRIRYDQSLPVVIYVPTPAAAANGDFFINIWRLNEGNVGQPAVNISKDQLLALPEFPPENLLIASTADGFISVYKLTTGEYQVNVGPLSDGKVHVIIFDAIPPYPYLWLYMDADA